MPSNTNGENEGDASDGDSSRVESLGEIFTAITDDETFVEEQRQGDNSTRLVDGSDPGDYVEEMVKATGLAETIGEGDTGSRQD